MSAAVNRNLSGNRPDTAESVNVISKADICVTGIFIVTIANVDRNRESSLVHLFMALQVYCSGIATAL
jgi:hypothetical protein